VAIVAEVGGHHVLRGALHAHAAVLHPEHAAAEAAHGGPVMADEEHGAAAEGGGLHFAHALAAVVGIAHGEHFIDDAALGLQVGGHGEAEAYAHAAAVTLHGGIDVVGDAAEGDDLVHLGVHLGLGHAQDGAVEVDVVAAGELGVEAGSYFQQAAHAALHADDRLGGQRAPG